MRRLDLIGMILTIIGASIFLQAIIIFAFFYGIYVPFPFLRMLYRVTILGAIIIGVLIFFIGIILRKTDHLKENKEYSYSIEREKIENEVADEFINFLKNNEGKAYTVNALLNRIYEDNQIEVNKHNVEELLQVFVKKNEIKKALKNDENFYFYEYK